MIASKTFNELNNKDKKNMKIPGEKLMCVERGAFCVDRQSKITKKPGDKNGMCECVERV